MNRLRRVSRPGHRKEGFAFCTGQPGGGLQVAGGAGFLRRRFGHFWRVFSEERGISRVGMSAALGERNIGQIVSSERHDELKLPPFPDETMEFDFLPDLEERQATLRRANEALERARVLLERVRRFDHKRGEDSKGLDED